MTVKVIALHIKPSSDPCMNTFALMFVHQCTEVPLYLHTVYMSCSHVLSWKVKLKLVTDSWRNSHSPCVLIISRENCVAREELEKGMSRNSSTEVRGEKPDLKEVKVKNITQTSVQSRHTRFLPHHSALQIRWLCCISVCQRGTCGRPSYRC